MDIKSLSDEQLIHLLQEEGNARYFSILTARYEKDIFLRCQNYVHDKVAAEDLTQEILIKTYLDLGNFRREARFTTWLYAIIHNTCIDHIRKGKKKLSIITEQLADVAYEIAESDDPISPDISLPVLNELLEQITPEEKLILLLKYREKQSIKDIHLSLGISESAVKMRLKRARTKISVLLEAKKK